MLEVQLFNKLPKPNTDKSIIGDNYLDMNDFITIHELKNLNFLNNRDEAKVKNITLLPSRRGMSFSCQHRHSKHNILSNRKKNQSFSYAMQSQLSILVACVPGI